MASAGGCKRYKCEAILQLDSGVFVLTAQVPNIQFETSGPLLATVHFGDVGHLDLAHALGMASAGGCKRYKCEAILQLDSGVLVLTVQVPNIQFETSGPLLATVHFSDVGHLDLAHLPWPLQEIQM